MTIAELINNLKEYPSDMPVVVVEGYENGFDDIENIKNVSLVLRGRKNWWDGKHEESKKKKAIKTVALMGNRNLE